MALTATLSRLQARPARSTPTRGVIDTLLAFGALHRQRRALARLDDRALADLGLSRYEARRESRRPFWDAPHNWHY